MTHAYNDDGVWPHTIADHVGVHGHKQPCCARRPPGFWKVGQALSGLFKTALHARRREGALHSDLSLDKLKVIQSAGHPTDGARSSHI